MSDTFSILMVCTGNICRSPLAEQLLRHRLGSFDFIRVDSAGIAAEPNDVMPIQSIKIAKLNGIEDPESHRAKFLTEQAVDYADLILGMDRTHRRAVVELSARSSKKCFTIREFAKLAEITTDDFIRQEFSSPHPTKVEQLTSAVEAARLSKADLAYPGEPTDLDVVDPFGHSDRVYQESAEQLIPAVEKVAEYLMSALNA